MYLEQRSWSIEDLENYHSHGYICVCSADRQNIKLQEEEEYEENKDRII